MVKALDAPTTPAGAAGRGARSSRSTRSTSSCWPPSGATGGAPGWLSNLHLGARGDDGGFVMVGKTFKGLTDELLRWQTEALQAIAVGTEDGYVVHVRPELVVEIALDGVQVVDALPGRRRPALRPGPALPARTSRPPTPTTSRPSRRCCADGPPVGSRWVSRESSNEAVDQTWSVPSTTRSTVAHVAAVAAGEGHDPRAVARAATPPSPTSCRRRTSCGRGTTRRRARRRWRRPSPARRRRPLIDTVPTASPPSASVQRGDVAARTPRRPASPTTRPPTPATTASAAAAPASHGQRRQPAPAPVAVAARAAAAPARRTRAAAAPPAPPGSSSPTVAATSSYSRRHVGQPSTWAAISAAPLSRRRRRGRARRRRRARRPRARRRAARPARQPPSLLRAGPAARGRRCSDPAAAGADPS